MSSWPPRQNMPDLEQVAQPLLDVRRLGPAAPDFEVEDVLPTLTRRALAYIEGGQCHLISRNGHEFSRWQPLKADMARSVRCRSALLDGDLHVPAGCIGLVIFAHGSGSSRFSTRNRKVAESLQRAGFATLLLDLLTREEEAIDLYTREFRFDIGRLGRRVVAAPLVAGDAVTR